MKMIPFFVGQLRPVSSVLRCAVGTGVATVSLVAGSVQASHAFSFTFTSIGVDVVTHQIGYNGTGGTYNISVGIDPTSTFAADMAVSVQNVVNTWNALVPTTGNLVSGVIPFTEYDFESVLLHEMGHSLGLGHPNLGVRTGVTGDDTEFTYSTAGADGTFYLGAGADGILGTADDAAGADGIIGSADDIRGDDVNLNYFRIADNDPFDTNLGVVDSTTYSRDIANLPTGDNYSANSEEDVGAALGYANTESVMQQGTPNGQAQRTLGADDVAGIKYSLTGLDELAGTMDDYIYNLMFVGNDATADIVIDFDNSETGFAESSSSGTFISSDHIAITSNNIYFNDSFDWHFNTESNGTPIPTPALLPSLIGFGAATLRKRRREAAAKLSA